MCIRTMIAAAIELQLLTVCQATSRPMVYSQCKLIVCSHFGASADTCARARGLPSANCHGNRHWIVATLTSSEVPRCFQKKEKNIFYKNWRRSSNATACLIMLMLVHSQGHFGFGSRYIFDYLRGVVCGLHTFASFASTEIKPWQIR